VQRLTTIDSLTTAGFGKPNFFILGAGRCGSTSLYGMLRQHPQIFMPSLKEPSFFSSYFQVVKNPVSYFALFNPRKGEKAIGEASHMYFSNPESAGLIHALFPQARFILIFRNPTDRAYSLYQWARKAGHEPLSFEAAIEAEPARFADPDFFRNCPQYFWNFMYLRSSYFHVQWSRYLALFPRDRFFVLSLYELVRDPVQWMQKLYRFLDVDASFSPNIRHLNARDVDQALHVDTRQRLDEHFAETVAQTNALAGRDLKLVSPLS